MTTTAFHDLNLRPELAQAVAELGYLEPTPIQAGVIPVMLAGQDVLGQAQTGTGKTAAFALPLLHRLEPDRAGVQALVVVPTRELALQVAQATAAYGRGLGRRVLAVYGGQPYAPQIHALKRGVDLLVGTPGRLLDLVRKKVLDLHTVRAVVLDEADEMLSMGFVEDIEAILAETPSERQTALFSATLPPEIRRLAARYLRDPQSITIQRQGQTVTAIEQRLYWVNESDKLAALTRLFEVEPVTRALVFVRTRADSGELANELSLRGFPAEALNGDLSQEARERTLNRFRQDQLKVLVATDVAARGLDIDGISHVFNLHLPDDAELYIHRIGRTGRAGKAGTAISLVSPYERRRLREIEAFTRQKIEVAALPTEAEIHSRRETELLERVSVWLQRGRCQRERELVESLVAGGHDPVAVAAAALKLARAEEKQRPIAEVGEVVLEHPRAGRERDSRGNRERPRRSSGESHEAGMVRLSLNLGRRDGIRPNDIVGAIAAEAQIPGSAIGKIRIQDRHSLVDVPEALAGQVLARTGRLRFRKQMMALERA
jgi:ATP-dependent RNA helicase DeaD